MRSKNQTYCRIKIKPRGIYFPGRLHKIFFLLLVICVCSSGKLYAQETELVSKKQKVPAWLNRALADANQLEGGLHIYQDWDAYHSDFKTSRAKTGMLMVILDPAGDGSLPSKLYQLKTWATLLAIPLQAEWEELSCLSMTDSIDYGATLRWNGTGWEASNVLTNDTIISIKGNLFVEGDTISLGNGASIGNKTDGHLQLSADTTDITGDLYVSGGDISTARIDLRGTDNHVLSLRKESLSDDRTITFPDASGDVVLVTGASLDSTMTLTTRLKTDNEIGIALNLKALPRKAQYNLTAGTGVALGFAIPASEKFNTTPTDSLYVGDVNQGALIHTAMIAARKDVERDSDLDTDLAFYTRKNGVLAPRFIIQDNGAIKLEGDTVDDKSLTLEVERLTDNQTLIFPNASGTLALRNDVTNDNLGNHTARENIQLDSFYLSNDGDNEGIRIDSVGNVGIGTDDTFGYTLAVNGTVGVKGGIEIENVSDWPDYVFEEGYELRELAEVEKFIARHGHLPGVPSQSEVDEGGINVGKMDARLLEKIEELTLYVLDMNKRINAIEKENNKLKRKLKRYKGLR